MQIEEKNSLNMFWHNKLTNLRGKKKMFPNKNEVWKEKQENNHICLMCVAMHGGSDTEDSKKTQFSTFAILCLAQCSQLSLDLSKHSWKCKCKYYMT